MTKANDPKVLGFEKAIALKNLGNCYWKGRATEVNFEKAFDCFKGVVKANPKHAEALYSFGCCYHDGKGTEVNFEKAFNCFKGAVKANPKHAGALNNLGYCYHYGKGTEENPGVAKFFNYLVANIQDAVKAVPIFFIDVETATEKELEAAAEAYEKGLYGLRHMGSENIEKQYMPLLERLYSLNKVTANRCIALGNYYLKEEQYSKALAYYEKAGALSKKEKRKLPEWIDNKKAFLKCLIVVGTKGAKAEDYVKLGIYYRDGVGVDRDHQKAYEAFNNAFEKHGRYDYAPCLEAIGLDAKDAKKLYKRLVSLKGDIEKAKILMNNGEGPDARVLFYKLQLEQIEKRLGGYRGPFMDVMKLLRDPVMKKWNVLKQGSSEISNGDWQVLKGQLISAVDYLYPKNAVILNKAKSFFNKTMLTKDAQASDVGMQVIRKRVESVLNYVVEGFVKVQAKEGSLDEDAKKKVMRKAKEVIAILADGGRACPDRAIVMLEKAESYIKMYSGGRLEYMPHVLVNLFKRNAIEVKLVPQNNQESIETYLYYLLKLNDYLGLGVHTKDMLYEGIAQKLKTSDALRKVYNAFTEGDLIGYVASHRAFQEVYKKEADRLKDRFEKELDSFNDELSDLENKYMGENMEVPQDKKEEYEVALAELEGERLQMVSRQEKEIDTFFKKKAEAMLLKAGFLTKEVWV